MLVSQCRAWLQKKSCLCVLNIHQYKNMSTILQFANEEREGVPDNFLYCIAAENWSPGSF